MTWRVEDVTVRYGLNTGIEAVSFELDRTSILTVIGGDGAGKTTLLRAVVGAVPAEGSMRIPPKSRMGFVSSVPGVYSDLTVEENLSFVARVYGLDRKLAEQRTKTLLQRAGLTDARDRLAANLSGGMRQKLALISALLHEPDLLVLDEPTTGVDPVSRAQLWQLIADAAAGGAGVLVASSYIDEAERGDSVIVLDKGRVLLHGAPRDVLATTPGAVLEFGSRPSGTPAWRRGRRWHAWTADRKWPDGAALVEPDMEDAVIVAALRAREESA